MESQRQAFHRSHERLEIAQAAISTFPPPRLRLSFLLTELKPKAHMETVEKWKSKIGISTFPPSRICLRRKEKVTMDCPEEQLISSGWINLQLRERDSSTEETSHSTAG